MKKITKLLLLLVVAVAGSLTSCRTNQQISNSMSYASFESALINISPSGVLTVRAWGSGPNEATAIEEAKKNVVADVLFNGFKTSNSYLAKPLVPEVNARERYAEYFNRFFSNGGEYKKFVTEASTSDSSRVSAATNGLQKHSAVLNVDRAALERQMKADGILR